MRSAHPKKASDVRGPKTFLGHNRIMGNAALPRTQNDNRPTRATSQPRTNETTLIIDQELDHKKRESKMTIRILLDNVSNDPVLRDVLRVFGIPLTYDDQNLYRILLQSKLLLDTKLLCSQLEKQNLVQELSSDFKSSTTMVYNHHRDHEQRDQEDDDFYEESAESNVAMTPRDAYDALTSAFPDDDTQRQSTFRAATAEIRTGTTFCPRASQSAIANSKIVTRYAEEFQILWLSRTVQNFFMFQRVNPRWNAGIKQYTKEDLFRMTSPTFRPEPRDLSGIGLPFPVITRIRINGADFEIHDIGGLSSRQRQHHIHSFDHADAFMFAASLAQYDEPVLVGAPSYWASHHQDRQKTNRLAAAINEFRFFLTRNATFSQRRPIVMLTQKDLFAAKMQYNSLAEQPPFTDFRGTPMQGVDYIVQKFKDFPHEDWALIQVLPASNQCSVSFFMESLRLSLMSDEETMQSTESY